MSLNGNSGFAERWVDDSGIPSGACFDYKFTVGEQTGTYWIHSHVIGQYPNGLRAPFIIHDCEPPYHYDDELVLSVSDWVCLFSQHLLMCSTMKRCKYSFRNSCRLKIRMVQSPFPMVKLSVHMFLTPGALIWDHQNGTQNVTPGSTVRFHLVNIGAFAYFHFWIECHTLTVIEVDGVDVEPYEVPGVDLAVGQRLSVLVKMDQDPTRNYPIVGSMGLTPSLRWLRCRSRNV